MISVTRVVSTKTGKRATLAALAFLAFSLILPGGALAQNDLLSQETIDNQIQQGKYVIPKSFFGMHINTLTDPWPTVPFANLRLEGSDVNWWNIESDGPGQYDYQYLDTWIGNAVANNVTLMYTFDGVPQWYSSVPSDAGCTFENGACDPPKDLNEDGTGTDAAFIRFVTNIVRHNYELGNPIQYWEMWNEPNQRRQWYPTCMRLKNCYHGTSQCTGTSGTNLCYAQLLRMAADAYPIIKAYNPKAVILPPAPVGWPGSAQLWMSQYLQWLNKDYGQNGKCPTGTPPCPDVIGYHGYLNKWVMGDFPIPENEFQLIKEMKATVAQLAKGKQMWITEGGWGNIILDGYNDAVLQTAFLARYILLQQSLGLPRGYWYQWDQVGGAGRLWQGPGAGNWRLPGYGYNSIWNWTAGATLTSPCALQRGNTIWLCKYGRPGGYVAQIAWSPHGSAIYKLPQKFPMYCDLKGNVTQITKTNVTVGIWPILLETKKLGSSACHQ